jgi:GST-like protein
MPQPLAWVAAGAAATVAVGLIARKLGAFKYKPPKVWQWEKPSGGAWAAINAPTSGARTQKALSVGKHPIQLYSEGTPNGVKVTIVLEEIVSMLADFDYDAWRIPINGEQFTSGFVEVNPNSKIPCMVDHSTSPPTRVFESGSIMIYLADKYKSPLLPTKPAERAEVISWLMWQMGSAPFLGGGFGHFYACTRRT